MSENIDKLSRKDRKRRVSDQVQGEGDYEAAARYREEVKEFVAKADIDALAHQAAPASAGEARDLGLAEDAGRDRSKGDDAADAGIMYPARKSDSSR